MEDNPMNRYEYQKGYRLSHKAQFAIYDKQKRKDNPEQYAAISLKYRLSHRNEINERHKKYRYLKYGWTKDMYDSVYNQQNSRCAICEEKQKELYIDHNHLTGITRGLLCNHCNWALGHFRESPGRLTKAISYLKEWGII